MLPGDVLILREDLFRNDVEVVRGRSCGNTEPR